MDSLKGEVAIVTGASSGIGLAIALAYAQAGAAVVIVHHNDKRNAEKIAKSIVAADGQSCVVAADVRDEAAVNNVFKRCRAAFGEATILVNSAGIDAGGVKVAEMELKHWENVLRTNLTGPFLFCRAFARDLLKAGRPGKIINISSVHQEIPRVGAAEYDASKGDCAI